MVLYTTPSACSVDSSFNAEYSRACRFPTAPRPVYFEPKSKFERTDIFPGPGAYRAERSSLKPNGVRFGSARRFTTLYGDEVYTQTHRRSRTPGPGDYKTEENHYASTQLRGGVIGRSRSRSMGLETTESSPGPTTYAVPRDTLTRTHSAIITAAPRKGLATPMVDSPGPCAYTPVLPLTPHAPATFGKQLRQVLYPSPKENTPGPCSYRPETAEQRPNRMGTFGRALKTCPNNTCATPGPGEYNPKWTKASTFGHS